MLFSFPYKDIAKPAKLLFLQNKCPWASHTLRTCVLPAKTKVYCFFLKGEMNNRMRWKKYGASFQEDTLCSKTPLFSSKNGRTHIFHAMMWDSKVAFPTRWTASSFKDKPILLVLDSICQDPEEKPSLLQHLPFGTSYHPASTLLLFCKSQKPGFAGWPGVQMWDFHAGGGAGRFFLPTLFSPLYLSIFLFW